jgi:hypothetical protein
VDAGTVLLLGTAAHVDWTNLPLRPIFLPLMSRLVFCLAGADVQRAQVVGAPFLVPLPVQSGPVEIEATKPSGDVFRVTGTNTGGRGLRYDDTHEVGIYLFRVLNAKTTKQVACAVNPDPDESDAATLSREELTQRLGAEVLVYCDDPEDVGGAVRRRREGQSLGPFLLIAVLVALMLESYFANCRGRKPS